MFKRQTLFVLGAGASAEFGLPVGKQLAEIIGQKMDIRFEGGFNPTGTGDMDLYLQVTSQRQQNAREFQFAGWSIRDGIGFAQSIDDFLDLHQSNQRVNLYGKAAIAKAILEAERASRIYFGGQSGIDRFDARRFPNTWLVKFMYMLSRGIRKENVSSIFDPVSFIVFNYDRCLQHFLLHALAQLYNIPQAEAAAIVAKCSIIHPYGVISPEVPFGAMPANYPLLASDVKTYTEQRGATKVVEQIAQEFRRAECIVFLGFAYHTQNMDILRPTSAVRHKPIYGTAFKMSDADVNVVSHQIGGLFSPEMTSTLRSNLIKIENNLTCADLFDNYAKSLTGGD